MKWRLRPDDEIFHWERSYKRSRWNNWMIPTSKLCMGLASDISDRTRTWYSSSPETRNTRKGERCDCRHRVCRGHVRKDVSSRLTHFVFSSRRLER